ncbi:hypothetical protein CLV30_101108 [Haloactinopolyspora alba]|uniref:Uncharacterized protein n=1 Tax=Haloactinopolyspora alba TaxID=648780 RepID=A0A2P8EFB3_9ACTN|nr:hypothetical protein CLV30_101108 [Haloactinopolyspora alba]
MPEMMTRMTETIMLVGVLAGLAVVCWFSTAGSDSPAHRGQRVAGLLAYLERRRPS